MAGTGVGFKRLVGARVSRDAIQPSHELVVNFLLPNGTSSRIRDDAGKHVSRGKNKRRGRQELLSTKANTSNGVGSRTRRTAQEKEDDQIQGSPLLMQKTLPEYQGRKLGNYLVKITTTALTHPSARCCLLPAKKWSRIKQRNTLLPPNTGSHMKNSATNSFHLHGTNVSTENPRDDPRHTFQAQP